MEKSLDYSKLLRLQLYRPSIRMDMSTPGNLVGCGERLVNSLTTKLVVLVSPAHNCCKVELIDRNRHEHELGIQVDRI
jgi:hypothetical protein